MPTENQQPNFENDEYKVIIYNTLSYPLRLCIVVESMSFDYKSIKINDRQYIWRKVWAFIGPKKTVYPIIMNRLVNAGILPINPSTPTALNPHNKAYHNLPAGCYNDIDFIVDSVIRGLTMEIKTRAPNYSISENTLDTTIKNKLKMEFQKNNPSVLIISSNTRDRKNKPIYVELEKSKNLAVL